MGWIYGPVNNIEDIAHMKEVIDGLTNDMEINIYEEKNSGRN